MRCVGTKKRSTRSNKETDGKGRSCRACSGITLIPAGPSTASDPPRPLNPKRTNDVLRKPDNCKSYGQCSVAVRHFGAPEDRFGSRAALLKALTNGALIPRHSPSSRTCLHL